MTEPSSPSESATGAVLHLYSDDRRGAPSGSSVEFATARAVEITKIATAETAIAASARVIETKGNHARDKSDDPARSLADAARRNLSGETLHENTPNADGRPSVSEMERWPIPASPKSKSEKIYRDAVAAERGRYDKRRNGLHRSTTQEKLAPERGLRDRAAHLWGKVRARFESKASRNGRTEREVTDLWQEIKIKRELSQKWDERKKEWGEEIKIGKRQALIIAAAPEIYKYGEPGAKQRGEQSVRSSEETLREDVRAFMKEAFGHDGTNLDFALSKQGKEARGEMDYPVKKDVSQIDREALANNVRSRAMVHGI